LLSRTFDGGESASLELAFTALIGRLFEHDSALAVLSILKLN
jgi:hypothetical protein